MISIFRLWLGIGAVRAAAKVVEHNQKEQERMDNTLCVCRDCHTEMLQGAKFCENCRSTNLVRRKEYKKEQEIISRDNQAAQLQQKHRFNKKREAKQYCAYVSKCRYCPECGNVNPPEVIYCGQCGVKTNRVPEDYVYNWMKDTYPDIIQNQNDLEGLEKIPDAEEITVGSVVAKSTIAVAKGGFWVGKWFVKSLAKELAKK